MQAILLSESQRPEGTKLALRPANGPLNPDANYRLVVQGSALAATLPWPRTASIERDVHFTTLRSPAPRPLAGPVHLKWGQPLQISWDAPIEDVHFEVDPPTPVHTAIDPANHQLSTVVLDDPADGQTYRITVADAKGANGIGLARHTDYTVIAPSRPKLVDASNDPIAIEAGKPLTLKWNAPVDHLALAIDPPAKTTWQVDKRDPTSVQVSLDELAQGTSYSLTVSEAVSKEGAPLAETPTLTLQMPEKLMVDDLETGATGSRVPVKAKPTVSFTQPIRDRKTATAALSIEPTTPGRWDWLDDQHVQFVPTVALPYDTDMAVKIKPGPDGARSADGSYFENQAVLAFTTEPDKLIDVDITHQSMALYEKGKVVRTYPVATGVAGARRRSGDFNVQYKMPQARFQGQNPNGSHYDIPDVHWVMAFMGDYTIHGAYWRAAFGTPAAMAASA